jgi:hypothetical protein
LWKFNHLDEKLDTQSFHSFQRLFFGVSNLSRGGRRASAGEFAVLRFVKPGALDVEELEAWNAPGQCECIDRELGDRLVGRGIRLVVEDVHSAVSDLQEVDVAGDDPWCIADAWAELDAMLAFELGDVVVGEPDRRR